MSDIQIGTQTLDDTEAAGMRAVAAKALAQSAIVDAAITAQRDSAFVKLAKLGLTSEEINSLVG